MAEKLICRADIILIKFTAAVCCYFVDFRFEICYKRLLQADPCDVRIESVI
jgi:hypothetical protein